MHYCCGAHATTQSLLFSAVSSHRQAKTWARERPWHTCRSNASSMAARALTAAVRQLSLFYRDYSGMSHRCVQSPSRLGSSHHAWVEIRKRAGQGAGGFAPPELYRPLLHHEAAEGTDALRATYHRTDPKVATLGELCVKGDLSDVVDAFGSLVRSGCQVDTSLLYRVLKRCMTQKNLALGRHVHALTMQTGHDANPFLANHIICMYACHGKLDEAMQVFSKVSVPDAHMWASIIHANARHGQPKRAMALYRQMHKSPVKPDNHVFVAVLKACAAASDLTCGREVHAEILGSNHEPDIFVWNCMVDMYAKCGSLEDARRVFDRLPRRDVVTWNAMLCGYAQHGLGQEALSLYARMQMEGLTPADAYTFSCLLKACATVGALVQGKQLHAQIQKKGMVTDTAVGNALVNMYSKCGSVEDAQRVFDELPRRDVVTWNALLIGYAQHNNGRMAVRCFEEMRKHGVVPNDSTLNCLLVACSHENLVDEGVRYFKIMVEEHNIVPTVSHYTSMVDLFGRAGRLVEAENVLLSMPVETDVVGWISLLSACKSHGDIERGRRCFDRIVEMEPEHASPYVLLGSMYASVGMWKEVENIESMRKCAGAWKKPAKACIEVRSKVHEFTVGEGRSDISSTLRKMNARVRGEGGHVPHTQLVLKSVSEKQKEDALCGHAEKLALAYGLMNTAQGTTLLVTKNLRMCNDCHSSTKVVSRLEKREIIVRDAHCVHRFVNGTCSCGDRH